ncbi:MAG: SUMF1/EgtB/PvdO family nonheme iron enzyme [Candidatus Omnitrophica bacterium]|nr:SUMF1/EgtB/PvdO family nonheme iron enzyme [Candidatus Omnitrophota bacterium]
MAPTGGIPSSKGADAPATAVLDQTAAASPPSAAAPAKIAANGQWKTGGIDGEKGMPEFEMQCEKCRRTIPGDSRFCPYCGILIQREERIELREESPEPQDAPASSPESFLIDLPGLPENAAPLQMILVPEGRFLMGDVRAKNKFSAEAPRRVDIHHPFYMGKYPVTQAQWSCIMGKNPSRFAKNPDHPVESVSWFDCRNLIAKLNEIGLGAFRLPTEAEWEYACRADARTKNFWGDSLDPDDLDQYAWYAANSGKTTHPVGCKQPNPWGFYDLQGNVWEWCEDWYEPARSSLLSGASGPRKGTVRVIRGGSFLVDASMIRSYARGFFSPSNRHDDLGLRLARAV